jgi:hypothetical protein
MPLTLHVFNPSDKERLGQVQIPWETVQKTADIDENELVLKCDNKLLPYQIDEIDPEDPSSKMLVFSAGTIPRSDNFPEPRRIAVIADKCTGVPNRRGNVPQLIDSKLGMDITGNGVKFTNEALSVWFNLGPKLNRAGQSCYAGAATSVQLYGKEILDAFIDDPSFHDPEKRCMQLDFVELFRPSWEPRHYWDLPFVQKKELIDRPYHVVSSSDGPVRVSLTIASDRFDYSYRDPFTTETRHLECRVFRIINLYAGAEYIVEDLFVKGVPKDGIAATDYVHLYFVAHYFSYLSFLDLSISRFDFVPDWFVASNLLMPFQAYGFATDRHTAPIEHPHRTFPNADRERCSFSFNLFPCKVAKSLHSFMRYYPADGSVLNVDTLDKERYRARRHFEDRAGALWDEQIYRPLWVTLA